MIEWWQCRERVGPGRCRAVATTHSKDGKTYLLRSCSKPEDHIHLPDKVNIFKERLITDIKSITKNSPATAMGKANYGKFRK